jgi:S1-C subfamily serine protease
VIALEKEDVHNATELAIQVAGSKIGSSVTLKLLRGAEEVQVSVKLEPRPSEDAPLRVRRRQ